MEKLIGVIGAGNCDETIYNIAVELGERFGENSWTVICGGMGGVMEAVCRGVKSKNGKSIGILPGNDPSEANSFVDFPIATGMGIGTNIIIIRSADVIVAVNGKYGTLSEIAFAMQLEKPVIGLQTWEISDKILMVQNVDEAIFRIKKFIE